ARIDDYTALDSELAAQVRGAGLRAIVGVPIVADGRLWGLIVAGTPSSEPLPAGLEASLDEYTELIGIAIANAQSREHLRRLADQQAALRRVATQVAEGADPDALFGVVAEEAAGILDVASVTVVRFEADDCLVVASFNDPGFPLHSRWPFEAGSL